MRISAKGRYSLAAMTYLALRYQAEKPIPLIAISESLGISKIYLEQVFTILKRTNLVISIKGPQGGYLLTKNPNEINIFEIFDCIEEKDRFIKGMLSRKKQIIPKLNNFYNE